MAKALPYFAAISTVLAQATAPAQAGGGWEQKVNEEGRKVQSLQISAPAMTEEDQYGYVMPDRYRCDSCKVVVFHLSEALSQRQPKKRQLRESELQELFDETCKNAFTGYGITVVDGENALSGPALDADMEARTKAGTGSIKMGGETWEKRLGEICRKFVYDKVGEDELYEHFRAGGKISQELCFSQSHDCQAPRKNEAKPKKQKAEKAPAAPPRGEGDKTSTKDKKREVRDKKLKRETSEKAWESREEQVGSGLVSSEEAGFASDDEVRAILQARAVNGVPPQEQRRGTQKTQTREQKKEKKSGTEDSQKSKQQDSKKKEKKVQDSQKSNAEQSREAREQKLKKDTKAAREKMVGSGAAASAADGEETKAETESAESAEDTSESDENNLDAAAFFKQLAAEHNLPADEYTRKRTDKEWEQVLMRAAGRIYESREVAATLQV